MLPTPLLSQRVEQYARQPEHRARWVRELRELLAFPSISATARDRAHVAAAAAWLATHLARIGLHNARVLPGSRGGPPSVYADWLQAPGQRTLLCYGHYDVQPAGPLATWRTPPFQPEIVNQYLFARGASDDKGQLFIHLKAIESYLSGVGGLPINVKVWLEGEEEVGSPNLSAFLDCATERLRADAVLISDTEMSAPHQPSIVYGLRGQVSLDLEVSGAPRDLHAGRYGGAVLNPLQALCELIAGLHDNHNRIAVPGVYARVRAISPRERQQLRCQTGEHSELRYRPARGEPGYTGFERTVLRPALVVQGMGGGKVGSEGPVVVPGRASARLSMRLVPDQEPAEIGRLLIRHLARTAPPGSRLRTRITAGSRPVLLSPRQLAVAAAARAVRATWHVPPVLTRSGGTIPVVDQLHRRLGAPIVLLGFGLASDNIHSANERLSLPRFFRGVQTVVRFIAEYAA